MTRERESQVEQTRKAQVGCRAWRAVFCCAALIGSLPQDGAVAAEPTIRYNLLELPSSRRAQAVLHSEANLLFDQRPLRAGLQELSNAYGITIWIDRRLDPNQLLTLSLQAADDDPTLEGRLQQIAAAVSAEHRLIENVIYFSPRGSGDALQRSAVELHDAISGSSDNSAAVFRELQWPELATPQELLKQIEDDWQIDVVCELPHDLFHAGRFMQPSTLATQLTVLMAGFGLEVHADDALRFRCQPLQDRDRWQAVYQRSDLDLPQLDRLRQIYPGSNLRLQGQLASLSGPTNFHLGMLERAAPRPSPRRQGDSRRWSFTVVNVPAEDVLTKLAEGIGFTLDWDPACTPAHRSGLITFQVEQANLQQLLSAVAEASRLTVTRDGDRVTVGPPKP